MPSPNNKKKTPKEISDTFWNSNAGRLARIDKPIQAVYPEFAILSGIRGANFNTINKSSRTLIKEPFRKKQRFELRKGLDRPDQARKTLGLELLKIFSPFRNGGKVNLNDKDYYSIMEHVAKENWQQWGDESEDAALTRILNANDYDYRGYYNKYPNSRANVDTHWTDEFKTVFHPTFSNESRYSGKISKFNPKGVRGGTWSGDIFIPNITQLHYINNLRNMARINNRLACGGRRKAWLGAAIGAASSLASGLIGSRSAKKQQEEALRQQRNQTIMQQNAQLASVYNSALAGNANLSNIDYTDNIIYRCGGRKKALNGKRTKLTTPYITDGGVAIPIGRGLSLLRGATHEDTNETGQTGIGIQVGRHQIEAENGEVAQKKGRELRIFSDQPMLNGISPADAVEAGYNPDEIFAAQEIYKKMLGIKDDGSNYKCGGRKKKTNGGLTRDKNYGSSKKPYPSVKSSDFAGKGRTYPIPTKAYARDALRLAGLHGRSDIRAKVLARYPSLRKKAAAGLIDYYDDVQENDATRTWGSSYNSRGRSIPYGAIENVGDGAYLTPVDAAIGEVLMPALDGIGYLIYPGNGQENSQQYIQAGVGPFIGKPRFARPRTIRPTKNLQTKRIENALNRANAVSRANAANKAIRDRRDFVIQSSSPVYSAGRPGKPVLPPTNIPYEYRLTPYNKSISNRLRSTGHNLSVRAQKLSDYLSDLSNKTGHAYRSYKVRRNQRKDAKERLARIKSNSNTSTNTSQNTNRNNNQTRWQKTKAYAKKQGKKAGIAAGVAIGLSAVGAAVNATLNSQKIDTSTNTNRGQGQAKPQQRQQAKSQKSNQTPTSTRNIKDIIRDVREATTKDYLTAEQKALIHGPIRVNSNRGTSKRRGARKTSKSNKQSNRERLLEKVKFVAPSVQPRVIEQRNRSIYDYTPEQIDRIKEEITQLPQERRLTRDEAIKYEASLNRLEYLNSKRNRSKKEFGGVNQLLPVERIGRRKYVIGGNGSYNNSPYKIVANWFGEEPVPIVNEPVIWQRSPISTKAQEGNTNTQTNSINNSLSQGTTKQSGITNPYWKKNNWGLNVKGADWVGLGTDILGSIGVGLLNNAALKDIKYDYTLPQYVDETPVAFDTTWHNGAQRANVERNRINARNIIGRNTASANAAIQRMQESDTNAMMEQNKLWDEKANKEAELRNMAAQNEQQVRARNAAARNAYYQQVADIRNREIDANNAIRVQRGQNFATSLAGIGQAASNFLAQAGQRYEDNQALRALAASRGAIMPSMIAAGVDMDDATLAGMIYNYNQRLQDPLVKPNRSDYTSDADYGRAFSKYEDENKLREQYRNAMELAASRLGMSRKGRRYLNRLGLR